MTSKFKRPPEMVDRNDPEEQYRSGYQHGANAALIAMKSGASRQSIQNWIELDLQQWRHDDTAEPDPPKVSKK